MEDGDKDKLVPNMNCKELRRPLQEKLFKFIIHLLDRASQVENIGNQSLLNEH